MQRRFACCGPGNGISLYGGLRSALVHAGYTTLRGKEPSYEYETPLAPVAFTSPTEYFDAQIGPSPRSRGMTYDFHFGMRFSTSRTRVRTGDYVIIDGNLIEAYSEVASESMLFPLRIAFPRHIGHERMVAALVDIVQREHAVLRNFGIARRS